MKKPCVKYLGTWNVLIFLCKTNNMVLYLMNKTWTLFFFIVIVLQVTVVISFYMLCLCAIMFSCIKQYYFWHHWSKVYNVCLNPTCMYCCLQCCYNWASGMFIRNCKISLRLLSHRSIMYKVFAIHTISSSALMTFKWCTNEGAESCLRRRANRIANTTYSILLCESCLICTLFPAILFLKDCQLYVSESE